LAAEALNKAGFVAYGKAGGVDGPVIALETT
jgi:hypothetical protein